MDRRLIRREAYLRVKKKRKWLRWVILLVIAAVVGVFIYSMSETTQSVAYNQYPVTSGDLTTYYNFDGLVKAGRMQTITAAGADTVKTVYAQQNSVVKEGDRICRLESGETIRADIDGEVTNLPISEGDVIAAGSVLCEIIDMTRLEVELNVDEYDVGAVKPGVEAQITVLSAGEAVTGVITKLNKNGKASGDLSYYTATAELEGVDSSSGVYPGMQVSAKILRGQALDAALVRIEAIQFDEYNTPYVLVYGADGETAEKIPVEVGVSDGVYAQIVSGVKAGDTVLKQSGMTMAELMMLMREQGM